MEAVAGERHEGLVNAADDSMVTWGKFGETVEEQEHPPSGVYKYFELDFACKNRFCVMQEQATRLQLVSACCNCKLSESMPS